MFILSGVARSGTSYMCDVLNEFPQIACSFEGCGALFSTNLVPTEMFRLFNVQDFPNNIKSDLTSRYPEKDLSGIVEVGIKIPFPDLGFWPALFSSKLKNIVIHRHPLDIFLSMHRREKNEQDVNWPKDFWLYNEEETKPIAYNSYFNFVQNMNQHNTFYVKYETLVHNPVVLIQILDFLNIRVSHNDCMLAFNKHTSERPVGRIDPIYGCYEDYGDIDPKIITKYKQLITKSCLKTMKTLKYDLL